MRALPWIALGMTLGTAGGALAAQSPSLSGVNNELRQQECQPAAMGCPAADSSKVMWILHWLADYGPRLTGAPRLVESQNWALNAMKGWGMVNAHLESYPFLPTGAAAPVAGWENVELAADVVAPFHARLVAVAAPWTPGTHGDVVADAVLLASPPGLFGGRAGASQAELDAWMAQAAPRVRGKLVLLGYPRDPHIDLAPRPLRLSDEVWLQRLNPDNPGRGGRGNGPPPAPPGRLSRQQVGQQVNEFLLKNEAVARLNDADLEYGAVAAPPSPDYDPAHAVPTVALRSDDYSRLARVLADGARVSLHLRVVNDVFPQGRTAYNAVADVAGSDKADEVILLGAHLDSWTGSTGATDDAVGCAVMLEAVRLLEAQNMRPRRTIRVVLWSGGEEGQAGATAYVAQHFGSFDRPKPEFGKLAAYFNLEGGPGKPRGASVFGPPAAATTVRDVLAPFRDWGFMGVVASAGRGGGNDAAPFARAGLPGVNFEQDPMDYNNLVWHSNLDTVDRVLPEDAREAAAEIAAAAYGLAMRDEMPARFAPADMPRGFASGLRGGQR